MSLLSSSPTPKIFHVSRKLNLKPPKFLSQQLPKAPKHLLLSPKIQSISTTSTTPITTTTMVPQTPPNWVEFGKRITGEWDGFCADFTPNATPIELPENVVPEAYREWEVKVFNWQTQCPTLVSNTSPFDFSYKLIKLLPTVGCEADAATRHTIEEKIAGESSAFGYDRNGCYIAVWREEKRNLVEIEHCLVRNEEVRVRVVVGREGVRVFSEHWDGPWRNGESLGGCAIKESGFAEGPKLGLEKVVGVWEETRVGLARAGESKEVFHELAENKTKIKVRNQAGIITLPKDLWYSYEEDDDETCCEVGWLLGDGRAMTSRCVIFKDGSLKEMEIAEEMAVSGDA